MNTKQKRVSTKLRSFVADALSDLPDAKLESNRRWYVQRAFEEGILAFAAHFDKHGNVPSSFRFELVRGNQRSYEALTELNQIEALLDKVEKESK